MDKTDTRKILIATLLITAAFAGTAAADSVESQHQAVEQTEQLSLSNKMNLELQRRIEADLQDTIDNSGEQIPTTTTTANRDEQEQADDVDNLLAALASRMRRAFGW